MEAKTMNVLFGRKRGGRRRHHHRLCCLSMLLVGLILLVLIGMPRECAAWVTPIALTGLQRLKKTKLGYCSTPGTDENGNISQEEALASTESGLKPAKDASLKELVTSVNYFISRKCNYSCKFCFHTQKTTHHLTVEQARLGLALLQQAGTEKINFAGGEPFLHPELLGELCRIASEECGLAVSIISNGSLITQEWMQTYGRYVDVLGVSIDSFNDTTNAAIGRGETSTIAGSISSSSFSNVKNKHVNRILQVREWCRQEDIIFKVNTVVCTLNWQEDMSREIQQLDPQRWKVFQVLLLEDENVGEEAMRDARPLVVSDEQFQAFLERHEGLPQLIPEPNDVMQNSYLLLDEDMRFLDCSGGGKVPGESILRVGVQEALLQAGFDHDMFQQRGGVYEWRRQRESDDVTESVNG